MRQEPTHKFTIIGSGRLALHIAKYLHSFSCEIYFWTRSNKVDTRFHQYAVQIQEINNIPSDSIRLILISDQNISQFIDHHLSLLKLNQIVHFSGSLDHSKFNCQLSAFHPLFTFTSSLYSIEEYEKITFVIEENSQNFNSIFPFFKNPSYPILSNQKLRYHALVCAICNFNSAIIQLASKEILSMNLQVPATSFEHIANQTVKNGFSNPLTCLTGPIARNDQDHISRQLSELSGSGLDTIYRSIIEALKDNK